MKNNANIILDLGQKSIRFEEALEETLDLKSKIFEQSLVEMEQKMVRETGSHLLNRKATFNPG